MRSTWRLLGHPLGALLVIFAWVGAARGEYLISSPGLEGLGKFTGGKWLDGTGNSILPFWQNAVKIPDAPAKPLVTFEWYRGFLQFMIDTNAAPWFTYVIVFGEIAVGLGLIVGAFVGLAAMVLIPTLAAQTRRHHDRRADEIVEIIRTLGEPTPYELTLALSRTCRTSR